MFGVQPYRAAIVPGAESAGASGWYVISTKHRRERFAAAQLERRIIDVCLPRLLLARRAEQIVRPLFPGYLFARLVLPRDWGRVAWTPSVCRLVTFEGEAPTLLDDVVAYLREQAGGDGVIPARPRPLPIGRRVRVTDGPL